jgi:hypothetical protein
MRPTSPTGTSRTSRPWSSSSWPSRCSVRTGGAGRPAPPRRSAPPGSRTPGSPCWGPSSSWSRRPRKRGGSGGSRAAAPTPRGSGSPSSVGAPWQGPDSRRSASGRGRSQAPTRRRTPSYAGPGCPPGCTTSIGAGSPGTGSGTCCRSTSRSRPRGRRDSRAGPEPRSPSDCCCPGWPSRPPGSSWRSPRGSCRGNESWHPASPCRSWGRPASRGCGVRPDPPGGGAARWPSPPSPSSPSARCSRGDTPPRSSARRTWPPVPAPRGWSRPCRPTPR